MLSFPQTKKKNQNICLCPNCRLTITLLDNFSSKSIGTHIVLKATCTEHIDINLNSNYKKIGNFSTSVCQKHYTAYKHQCIECDKNLCEECKKEHNEKHILTPYRGILNTTCSLHEQNKISSFCETCKVGFCNDCKSLHNGHKVVYKLANYYLQSYSKDIIQDLLMKKERQATQMNDIIINFLSAKSYIQQEEENIQNSFAPKLPNILTNSSLFLETPGTSFGKLAFSNKVHGSIINSIKEMSNDRIATSSMDSTIKIWDMNGFKPLKVLGRGNYIGKFLPFDNDKKIVVVEKDVDLVVWNTQTWELQEVIVKAHSQFISDIQEHKTKHYVFTVDIDSNIKVWNLNGVSFSNGVITIPGNSKSIDTLLINSEFDLMFTTAFRADRVFAIWDISNFGNIRKIFVSKDCIEGNFVRMSRDFYCTFNTNFELVYITVKKNKPPSLNRVKAHLQKIIRIAFIKNNVSYVCSASKDKTVKLWEALNKTLYYTFNTEFIPMDVIDAGSGLVSVAMSNNEIIIYHVTEQKEYLKLKEHKSKIKSMILFSNKFIVTGDNEGYLRIYE